MPIEEDLWRGRRVLITGHTGFKGAWLSLWLQQLGACVIGVAPGPPSEPSLYTLANVSEGMHAEHAIDVRDRERLRLLLAEAKPEVVMHLAAQPMVRCSLIDPVSTYEVNVMGTANLLEAVRLAPKSPAAVIVVTSDKCYENPGEAASPQAPGRGGRPLREGDPLGGEDPYSSSKACAELVVAAYRRSFFGASDAPRLATARAGNVIGGGDWGEDRLLPDVMRIASGDQPSPLWLRNPEACRPWQHVLNPLLGYLMLAQRLLGDMSACGAWNFGPPEADVRPVSWVVERLRELWGDAPAWELDRRPAPREASWLALDSRRALAGLGWRAAWDLDRALKELVDWHLSHLAGQDMRAVSVAQIDRFMQDATSGGVRAMSVK